MLHALFVKVAGNNGEQLLNTAREPQPSTSAASSSPVAAVHAVDSDWVRKFVIRWEKLPASLMTPLKSKKKPTPVQKNSIVKFVVDEMKRFCPNPDMNQTRVVARHMVAAYPESFEDRTDEGERLGDGFYSLAKKLKTRIEYTNRGIIGVRIRQCGLKRQDSRQSAANPASSRSGLQYGCINWQPRNLPENETEESLNSKMAAMQELLTTGGYELACRDVHHIDADMTATYTLQRRLINSDPPVTIETIQKSVPFLFYDRWLFRHFEQLVGKPPYTTLRETLASKSPRILAFFRHRQQSTKEDINLIKTFDNHTIDMTGDTLQNFVTATLLHLMMGYFGEQEDSLFLLADVRSYFAVLLSIS